MNFQKWLQHFFKNEKSFYFYDIIIFRELMPSLSSFTPHSRSICQSNPAYVPSPREPVLNWSEQKMTFIRLICYVHLN